MLLKKIFQLQICQKLNETLFLCRFLKKIYNWISIFRSKSLFQVSTQTRQTWRRPSNIYAVKWIYFGSMPFDRKPSDRQTFGRPIFWKQVSGLKFLTDKHSIDRHLAYRHLIDRLCIESWGQCYKTILW
jgi:hypothetical protein